MNLREQRGRRNEEDVMYLIAAELTTVRQAIFERATPCHALVSEERPPTARRVHATLEVFP